MRSVRYRATARADLSAIADHYHGIDPDVAARILADIERAVAYLREYPHLGQPAPRHGLRGKLSRRYRFKVVYRVTPDAVEIVGVFRFQNREA